MNTKESVILAAIQTWLFTLMTMEIIVAPLVNFFMGWRAGTLVAIITLEVAIGMFALAALGWLAMETWESIREAIRAYKEEEGK